MASFDRTYSASPVLTMPPQPAYRIPFDEPTFSQQPFTISDPASWEQTPRQAYAIAGRKRSRDEAAVNLDPPEKVIEPPIKEAEEEWIYGEGMTLIKPDSGYVVDASSQSGTWVEEQAAIEEAEKTNAALLAQDQLSQARPSLRSNKSQRLEMATSFPPNGQPNQLGRSSPSREVANPMTASADSLAQPIVDDFTLHLGIGWSRIGEDEHMQAAARGWARYIENHYPVNDVKILLQSRGLQSYLVEANEGIYLFADTLREGQLVSNNADRALQNLKSSPPVFDGAEVMHAAGTPRPQEAVPESTESTTLSTAMDLS